MRMWVGDTDHLTFVFKDQNMLDLRPIAKLDILLLPTLEQITNLFDGLLSQCRIVNRAVANDSRLALSGAIAVKATRGQLQVKWRRRRDAGQIVVEDEDARIMLVPSAVDSRVSRAEVAIS
jgi:hypothetical protein